jgi:hypothetical protein
MGLATHRVSPFGHPGLTGCVRLPPAFRSLPRPSSPLYTQASPVRFRSLDYMIIKSSKARALIQNTSDNRSKTLNEISNLESDSLNPTIYHLLPLSNSGAAFRQRDRTAR